MENAHIIIAKDLLKIKAVFFRPWEPFPGPPVSRAPFTVTTV